jgi:hypothetical protein
MLQRMRWAAPMFLFIGTSGLLLNEFIFTWGRSATLAFALVNIFGLVQLVITYKGIRRIERSNDS